MFTDEFLDSLPDDPHEATAKLCNNFATQSKIADAAKVQQYEKFLEAYAVLQPFTEVLGIEIQPLRPGKSRVDDIRNIEIAFNKVQAHIRQGQAEGTFAAMQRKYQSRFGAGFMYEFTDGDLKRIQELIDELRGEITKSELFDENHRQRMLKRLEKLQTELHKKMSTLDVIWGVIGEAGVVLGKFGSDVKPLADRYIEIAQIGWRSQARAEELPSASPFPLLSDGKEKEDEDED